MVRPINRSSARVTGRADGGGRVDSGLLSPNPF